MNLSHSVTAVAPAEDVVSRRDWCLALAVLLLAAGCLFIRQFAHPDSLLVGVQRDGRNDLTSAFIAYRLFPAHELRRTGEPPLWNRYELLGMPWFGEPQSALLYPPNWLLYLFPLPALVSWLQVLHPLWGGLGTWRLCRMQGLRQWPSLLGGVLFLGAPYLLAQLLEGHYNQVCVVAWYPWALIGWERVRRNRPLAVGGLALILLLALLAGHPQEVYYLGLLISLYAIEQAWHDWRARKSLGEPLIKWLMTVLLVSGLFSPQLIPAISYASQSVRSTEMPAELISPGAFSAVSLKQLGQPFALGQPGRAAHEQGRWFWETLCYFGVLPLLAAAVGCVPIFLSRRDWWLPAGLVLLFLYAFGPGNPVYELANQLLPGLSQFRVPARTMFPCSFLVALLAARGVNWLLEWLQTRFGTTRQRLVWSIAAVLLVASLGELTWFSQRISRTVPASGYRLDSEVTDYLREHSSPESRVLASQDYLTDAEAWVHGLQKVQGYEPVPLIRSAVALDALSHSQNPAAFLLGFEELEPDLLNPNLLDAWGVRYLILPAATPVQSPGWKLVHAGVIPEPVTAAGAQPNQLPFRIYENGNDLPRAWVQGTVREIREDTAPVPQLETLRPREELLLARDVLPEGKRQPFQPAEIVRYSTNHVSIRAELNQPGYLVVSDTWSPGWRARVNGEPRPVLPANLVCRAVPLPAGQHLVELDYEPPGGKLGLWLAAATVVLYLIGINRLNRGLSPPVEKLTQPSGRPDPSGPEEWQNRQ